MKFLILVLVYIFIMATATLAHPRLYPRNPEIETVMNDPGAPSSPLKKDDSYNVKYGSKRSTTHIKRRDDNEDVSDDFQRDLRMGYDASGDMQAHYGYFSKRDHGYPSKTDHELKRKHLYQRNVHGNHEPPSGIQYWSKRRDENANESGPSQMADHGKDCCSGLYTEEGLMDGIDCECNPYAIASQFGEPWTPMGEEECAEKIYTDYRKKHPSEKYVPIVTPEEYEAAQEDCRDCEENDLQLQKTYEEYYQELRGECFQRKESSNTELWETNIFETDEGQIHETAGPFYESEDSIYETGEGQLHETNNHRFENEKDTSNDNDGVNSHPKEPSTDDPLELDSSTKQKEPVLVTLLEFVCTTNSLSPLSVDVFRIAEYFNNDGLERICRVNPLRANRCTRIGGIGSASIGVCDHYFGWQTVCADVAKQIFELIRRCEELIDGRFRVSGKISRQGWGGNVIIYRLV